MYNQFKLAFVFAICFALSYNINANTYNLEDAKLLSSQSGKNIFVNYTADWCLPCQMFKKSVLSDSNVKALLESDFIQVNADYDDPASKNLFESYEVCCLPTLHILDKKGEVLKSLSGTNSAGEFYKNLLVFSLQNKQAKNLTKVPITPLTNYTIQAGAFSNHANAIQQKRKIEKLSVEQLEIVLDNEKNLYRLNIGQFVSLEEMAATTKKLRESGIAHFIKRNN